MTIKLKKYSGILYPAKMKRRSWIVLGPPGSGKSWLIDKIGGWPGEVCLDICRKNWWSVEPLAHRPREIQLALPFKGYDEGISVYDDRWKGMNVFPDLDTDRIRIPEQKKFILAPDWRARFVFDFILPPPTWLYNIRMARLSSDDVRLVDMGLTRGLIAWQVHVHWRIACFFHNAGLQVMLRPFNTARPYSVPVLKKIARKKAKPSQHTITPSLDWSKVRYVRSWIDTGSSKFCEILEEGAKRGTKAEVSRKRNAATVRLLHQPCPPQELIQPSLPGNIHGVSDREQSEPQP